VSLESHTEKQWATIFCILSTLFPYRSRYYECQYLDNGNWTKS